MRLAVFTSSYPAQTATFFERDMRALAAAGVIVDVYCVTPLDASLWRFSSADRSVPRERVHHLTLRRGLTAAAPVLARQTHPALSDASRALVSAARYGARTFASTAAVLPKAWAWSAAAGAVRYDHVLGYWGNYAGTCAWAFHRLLDQPVPFTLWLHAGDDLYQTPVFMRQKLAYADRIVTCCEFNRDYIRRRFGATVPGVGAKVHVSHHGLDLAEFRFEPEGRPPATLLAVGPLQPRKGFEYLLRAGRELARRGTALRIEIVGDGPERDALRRLALELGIDDRVRFRGWLTAAEARTAMTRATVLVHPSDGLGDGLPNVVREAMAVGTPVVASAVAGIPDALDGGCGVLVPPRDVAALAEAIAALLADPQARATIADRARRRVEDRYDLWRNGQRLAALLASTERRTDKSPWRLSPLLLRPGVA
jgi:glycosyltransferase involved in cell wall biosynthesis